MNTTAHSGRLVLVPNTLDLGTEAVDLHQVLPLRVIERAAQLTHWIAESAKTTRAFLKRVDAVAPLVLPFQQLQIVELPRARKGAAGEAIDKRSLEALLAPAQAGHDVGLISEAGMPAIADPGAALVEAAHALGVPVLPLSGPNSLMLALAASGLNGQCFSFVGYLPVEAGARTARIRELEAQSRRQEQTQLVIETPYRNAALLGALLSALSPATQVSVSCGLTLPDGWSRTASVAQWRSQPTTMPDKLPAVFAFLAR